MSKIKNYGRAIAYKVAKLLDLVDDNEQLRDGNTISLLKDGTPVNEANTPINIVLHKNDDDTAIFVDGFLNGTAISTANLYPNMSILENAIEIVGHRVWGNYFTLIFNDIANAPATNITEWNTFFDTSTKANTDFTHYEISNNSGLLFGPSALTLKQSLFLSNTSIISITDTDIITNIESSDIDNGAFYQCTNLISISLAKATIIGDFAFQSCTSLSSVTFPSTTSIGNYVFYGCNSLSSVTFPNTTIIGNSTFGNCSLLSSVSLPSTTTIGSGVFYGCGSLSNVDLPRATTIGAQSFVNCVLLSNISLPSATTIGDGVFNGCTSLSIVSLPSATTIGTGVFIDCVSLSGVSLPKVISIGDNAFYMNTPTSTLTYLNLSSCTSLGADVFSNISGCTMELYIPLSMTGGTNITYLLDNNDVTLYTT